MNEEQFRIPGTEEMDNPDGAKKERPVNILQEMLAELMSERKVEMADIVKATGIKFPTLHDWVKGNVQTQKMDKNLWKLAQYFDVSLEYLCLGLGDDSPPFKKFEEDSENEKDH